MTWEMKKDAASQLVISQNFFLGFKKSNRQRKKRRRTNPSGVYFILKQEQLPSLVSNLNWVNCCHKASWRTDPDRPLRSLQFASVIWIKCKLMDSSAAWVRTNDSDLIGPECECTVHLYVFVLFWIRSFFWVYDPRVWTACCQVSTLPIAD